MPRCSSHPNLLLSAALLLGGTLGAADAGESARIHAYILGLNYDPRTLLRVTDNGTTSALPRKTKGDAGVIICTSEQHRLAKDLDEITILSPAKDAIFPGALVKANLNLANGKPDIIAVPRGPVHVTLNLPNLKDNGSLLVADPSARTVQAAIQAITGAWFSNPANTQDGQAAQSYFETKKGFSSQQLALSLGLNAKWDASNSFSVQGSTQKSTSQSTCVALYKQVYFTASIDPPEDPADVFGPSVTLARLKEVLAGAPPAYVKSVDFGRIIMIRMETRSEESEHDLAAAMKMATSLGGVTPEVDAETRMRLERILRSSSFRVLTLGGNASDAAQVLDGSDPSAIQRLIESSATFSSRNPPVPIAYAVNFLRNNEQAKLSFSTDYTETVCREYPDGFVKIKHAGAYVAKWEISWQETDATGRNPVSKTFTSGNQTAGYQYTLKLPGDATHVTLKAWAATGLVWNPWNEIMNKGETGPTNACYKVYGTTLSPRWNNDCN